MPRTRRSRAGGLDPADRADHTDVVQEDHGWVEVARSLTRTTYCPAPEIVWLPATGNGGLGPRGEGWGNLVVAYHIEPIRSPRDEPLGGAVRLDFLGVVFFSFQGKRVRTLDVLTDDWASFSLSYSATSRLLRALTDPPGLVPAHYDQYEPRAGPNVVNFRIDVDDHGSWDVVATYVHVRRFQWEDSGRSLMEQAMDHPYLPEMRQEGAFAGVEVDSSFD